jgi:hypothetical protein
MKELQKDYIEIVSHYNDALLLEKLHQPATIESDEYEAVILELYARQLITKEEFDEFFSGMSDNSSKIEDETEPVYESESEEYDTIEEEISENPEDYWKCPVCGELIEHNYDACWKCEGERPEIIEYPDKEEVMEMKKKPEPIPYTKNGFSVMFSAIIALVVLIFFNGELSEIRYYWWIFGIIILGFGFLAGLIMVIKGSTGKDKHND